jgi:hypothetical protein
MKDKNIHEYENKEGRTQYAVCVRDELSAQWWRILDSTERRLTGCTYEYSRTLAYFGGFTKAEAYGRARTLFGYARIRPSATTMRTT